MLPVHQEVNGISIPNVEPQNTEMINYFIMNKVTSDKKAKKSLEDGVEYSCSKSFCSFCLKIVYDTYLPQA